MSVLILLKEVLEMGSILAVLRIGNKRRKCQEIDFYILLSPEIKSTLNRLDETTF